MKRVFRRPSPAMVIAVVALIAALGGTAIAGGVLNKKKVNKIITNRAPGLSVSNAKTADSATNATNAATVGGKSIQAAVVNGSATTATVVRGSATGAGRLAPGIYFVSFPVSIQNCTYVATNGDVGAASATPGEISVEQRSASIATDIEVRHRDSAGALTDYTAGGGFHIAVVC